MHEGALCREIIETVERAAKINGLSKVYEILIVHGPHSAIEEYQLNFYFNVAKIGTVMEEGHIVLQLDEEMQGIRQIVIRSITGD